MQAVQQQRGPGAQVPREPLRRRISNFLSRLLSQRGVRTVFWVVIIAAFALLAGYLVYSEVSKKLASNSAVLAEAAQASFAAWQSEADTAKKATLEKDLVTKLDSLISRYPRQYGGQRGLFVRAELGYQRKDWDAALKDYELLAARFPKSYLAAISLFNAAVCREEKGETAAALKLYVQIGDTYTDSPVAPRAKFNEGRLSEAQSDWATAQKAYESLATVSSSSVWNKLAKNRLVELKVLG